MKLSTALRLNASPKVAFVGAGGKTSGIFLLGRQLLDDPNPLTSVMISTTTHMGLFQSKYADHHIIVDSWEKLIELQNDFPKGMVLISGSPVEGKGLQFTRINGIPAEDMLTLVNIHAIPLLIEADGSRMLPLKAPADYEPVIPEYVDMVVVLAGLSGLGKPLTSENVHRVERFAALSQLSTGETITPQALARVLKHPQGGLKNIPPQARRIVLFNQADTQELQSIAQGMAVSLLEDYHAVVIASLNNHSRNHGVGGELEALPADLNFPKDSEGGVISVHEQVAGIVLAAGEAKRFGQPKQLLIWQGQPLVRRATQTALDAGLSPVIVVTGAVDEPIREALQGLAVQIVHNGAWQEGQSTSVKTGLSALPENLGGCMILLADQPRVTTHLLHALIELHATTLSPITAPQVEGQRANPVLFDRVTFNDLRRVTGDQGGRGLFSRFPTAWLPWQDSGVTLDIDTPADFQRLIDE